ncbi:hypothetical protein [Cupriavidus sp. CuC1]|uniref:hypothetical protein n=1 Tax=Cupriavidus sp. CuC1 TaxID=3373131 RepID=UPI0037D974D8
MQPLTLTQIIDFAGSMLAASTCAALVGGMLGGFVYSLCFKVLDHLGDRLAERTNRKLEEEVLQLRAQCWRLRVRNSKGGA